MALAPRPTYGPNDPDAPLPRSSNFSNRLKQSPGTIALIAVNIVVFLAMEYFGGREGRQMFTDAPSGETLVRFGANNRILVFEHHQYWRLVSSMFVHIGIVHLGVNMYFGFGWSTRVEQWFGTTRFLIAYFVTGIVASLASAVMNNTLSAGASGALFGMIGVTLAVLYRSHGTMNGFLKDPAVRATLVNLAILTVLGMTVLPLDNWAHGGGLVAGGAIGLLLIDDLKRRVRARKQQQTREPGWSERSE